MKSITVLTPTFNRATTLKRVYDSLVNQTDNDFLWMVVDDGSTDDTEDLIQKFQNENKIRISFYKIAKSGQHKALQLGFDKASTKYLIKLDSDDALTCDAIESYKKSWETIEKEQRTDIGNISALSGSAHNDIVGNWRFPEGVGHIDSDWFEMVLKFRNNNDLSSCTRTSILKEVYPPDYSFWNEDKTNIIDGVLLPRLSRRCKTRYINKTLQLIYFDAPFSSLRSMNSYTNKFWKVLIDNTYFLNENIDHFFWNPGYYIRLILKLIISTKLCGIGIKELFVQTGNNFLRFLIILFYPLSLLFYVYYKYIRREFWI